MNVIEAVALIILGVCAAALVVLAVTWDVMDRRPLDPPLEPPSPPRHPRHRLEDTQGFTIRLRPPD